MELFEAISGRRSVRAFTGEPLREGDLERILKAGTSAPSAGNLQPWEFVVAEGRETKADLARAALGQAWMEEAAVIITVCACQGASAARYGRRGAELYCIQDTAAAVQNMLLASTALGYGACWVGAFDEEGVRGVLGIPAQVRPVAMLPVGVPLEYPAETPRKGLASLTYFERYGERRRPGR